MDHQFFMKIALDEAKKSNRIGDVPVGAVIVRNGKIISKAHNLKEKKQNALYHAEVLAISRACKKLKSFRLNDCELYVTLEPCLMCCGAIIASRLKKIYFGAYDKNYGCAGSKYDFLHDKSFECIVESEGGVLEDECRDLITTFFGKIRKNNRRKK